MPGCSKPRKHGTLDVRDSVIDNTGTDPVASIKGILIDGTSTLMVDTSDLQLTGGGTVTLEAGSQIVENTSSFPVSSGTIIGLDTLDNVDNTIEGAGSIGNGDGHLHLTNEAGGTIEADIADQQLVIDTGTNTITNAGTLSAINGGELDVHSTVNNSGGNVQALSGGFVDFFLESAAAPPPLTAASWNMAGARMSPPRLTVPARLCSITRYLRISPRLPDRHRQRVRRQRCDRSDRPHFLRE